MGNRKKLNLIIFVILVVGIALSIGVHLAVST